MVRWNETEIECLLGCILSEPAVRLALGPADLGSLHRTVGTIEPAISVK
jgi:hypothetical protein